jgi:Na+-transporting methylmalonyl-CoA/oxaloacetate decarboxylase gamma subunit
VETLFVTTLIVSGIGLLLLFLALLILYGLMYLMTAVLQDPASGPVAPTQEEQGAPQETTAMYRAAAIAIALARARQAPRPANVGEGVEAAGSGFVSSWWTMHHHQQLTRDPHTRRMQ